MSDHDPDQRSDRTEDEDDALAAFFDGAPDDSVAPGAVDDDDRPLSLEEIDMLAPVGRIVVRRRDPSEPPGGEGSVESGPRTRRSSQDAALADDEGLAVLAGEAPPAGPGSEIHRASWREESSGWWRWGYPITMLVLVLLVPVLLYTGYRTILESNDSDQVRQDLPETAPGWEALVEPTQTMAVGFTDDQGKLAAVSVLSFTGESAGGIVTIHPATVGPVPGNPSENTLPEIAYADGGAQGMSDMVAALLNAGLGDVAVLDPSQLSTLLEPVGSLDLDNADVVTTPDTRFPRGQLTLAPDDAGAFLNTRNQVSDDLDRMDRYNDFWAAWLQAIAASSDGSAIPGETDSGLGLFLSSLAGRQIEIQTLPVQASPLPGDDPNAKIYLPLHPKMEQVMVTIVPFPVGSPPGARVRVRLLDGTGQLNHGLPASPLLVFRGAEISVIGNANSFDNATTQIVYYDDVMADSANAMRDALGVGTVEKSEAQGEPVDVTIVLGEDWASLPAAQQQIQITQGTTSAVGTTIQEPTGG